MQQLAITNAYLDDDGAQIVLRARNEDGTAREWRVSAEYTTWHRAEDIGRERMRQLKGFSIVKSIAIVQSFVRIAWDGDDGRRSGREGMRENDCITFEGDVDPVMLWLVESKTPIAKPRRCYLDLEGDSDVALSNREGMRILSWAVVDDETGEEFGELLEEDTDDGEEALLRSLVALLQRYDQICVWEGDWRGGEFDSVVFPARCRRQGLDVDERQWLWLNQLAVWKKMNQHSAESGAEKESFKLEDIAYAQLGKGKEPTPDWVRERWPEKAAKGMGGMTRELWNADGRFRKLLLEYNKRDARLLRELEREKGYITLFQSICEVCGILPRTRSLFPTTQMDGFMLRLGREKNYRFPTKQFREELEGDGEEEDSQFRGALVIHPKTVESDHWSDAQATAFRAEHGMRNGILRDVHVCDFASLYPSMMRTFNLSSEVVLGWAKTLAEAQARYGPQVCVAPGTGLVTRRDVIGFLPLAFAELGRLRKYWSDLAATLPPGTPEWQNAMSKSIAYKVVANSFYGAGGSKYSRYHNVDVSEGCTQSCVHFLKITAAEAEKRSMVVVYGDTDSVFVFRPSEEGYRKFIGWLNAKRFPQEVEEYGARENHIKLAFEKTFSRLVFVTAKGYIGRYSQYKGIPVDRECHDLFRGFKKGVYTWRDDEDEKKGKPVAEGETCPVCGGIGRPCGKPEIKGIAYKRGDKGKLARELQGRVIDCLVGGVKIRRPDGKEVPINRDIGIADPTEDVEVYKAILERARAHVLEDELAIDEVRLSKALNKSLRDYGKDAREAHVRVARQLKERGYSVGKGTRIEYVVVDGGVSPQVVVPAEDFVGECDRFYLWERVYSPTKALLLAAFPDERETWEKLGKVRPPKRKKSKVPEQQLGLGIDIPAAAPKMTHHDELAVPAYRAKPLVVRVPEQAGAEALDRVKKVFKAHPGARNVTLVLDLVSGAQAIIPCDFRISPSPAFKEEIEQAIASDDAP